MTLAAESVQKEICFFINEKEYKVSGDVAADTSLNAYVRDRALLKGTKYMCQEGGCGACVVSVTSQDPVTKAEKTYAVNSCLVPIFSCHGWHVTTIEGLGGKAGGYHPIQQRLSEMHGTQCGYCSPGMVMNMYALSKGRKVTMQEVENSFGGNICRCTGYRPILDAFKSLAVDAPPTPTLHSFDIEDLARVATKKCPKSGLPCSGLCGTGADMSTSPVHIRLEDAEWFRVVTIKQLLDTLALVGENTYMLVCGNTAQGVYRRLENPHYMIDVSGLEELLRPTTEPELVLGANMSLATAKQLFISLAQTVKGYAYLQVLAEHIDLIANVPVCNIGSIAGNLSIKHQHREFPSDMFLMLETVGATLTVMERDGSKKEGISLRAYLDMDMKMRFLYSVHLSKFSDEYTIKTYKIMPRAQNAHAYVNAGFVFKINREKNGLVMEIPNIVFGGIEPQFMHATETENYLTGKSLFDPKTLEGALASLDKELVPDVVVTDASIAYRKGLAQSLFYKFVLSLMPDKLPKNLISGGQDFVRPLSSGKQEYETDKSVWPLNQPIAKVESLFQCSGEAEYVNDIQAHPGELYGALVLTRVGQGTIKKIDATEALKLKGVVAFYDAKDIPGKNSFITKLIASDGDEELFCSGEIVYAGQPVGILVAQSQQLANTAARLVQLQVEARKGVYLMSDVLESGDHSRVVTQRVKEATNTHTRKDATKIIKGTFRVGSQYHYTMETQSCLCVPVEDGMDVFPATQWMDAVQVTVAAALALPAHAINVRVRRLGGAYGAKISRSGIVATACAVAAHHLNKPVRMVMTMETNMESCGKRFDCSATYEVGVDAEGRIKYLDTDFYHNSGWTHNESVVPQTVEHMVSCYEDDTWTVNGKAVRTDTASNTYCRAPGSVEAVAFIEQVMEHVARVVKRDSIEVRLANMKEGGGTMQQLVKDHREQADLDSRRKSVDDFNKANRWKKRGIALVPMRYPLFFWGNFHAIVSIYANDGTVSVAHGGIEMGQGINTKVAQVAAHILGIPLEMVQVKPSNSLTAPNGMVSGGSIASEVCAYAAMMCCKDLLKRLEPVKAKLTDPTWPQITMSAFQQNVDLCATYMFTAKDDVKNYDIWGVTIAEVEVDLLTGQPQILRVDILEDAGKSLSPEVDVGQVEGAFVMGIGYFLSESLIFHPETGELLTNRTWNYKPPGAKDIPIDFRIQLRRNSPNPTGVLRSKATGEPPQCMSVVVLLAVRNALDSARADSGKTEEWYDMYAPATPENIFLTGLTNIKQFSL